MLFEVLESIRKNFKPVLNTTGQALKNIGSDAKELYGNYRRIHSINYKELEDLYKNCENLEKEEIKEKLGDILSIVPEKKSNEEIHV